MGSNLLATAKSKLIKFWNSIVYGVRSCTGSGVLHAPRNLKDHNSNLMLLVSHVHDGILDFSVISTENNSFNVVQDNLPDLSLLRAENYDVSRKNANFNVVGSCDTWLLLLHIEEPFSKSRAFVMDLITSKLKPLDRIDLEKLGLYEYGLGFDPATGDYKVVKLRVEDPFGPLKRFHAHLLSLKTGLLERIKYPYDFIPSGYGCPHINGFCYWIAHGSEAVIISLDLAKKKFLDAPIPVPESDRLVAIFNIRLAELHGSLAVIIYDFDLDKMTGESIAAEEKNTFSFEIWVWNKEGCSWSLVDTIHVNMAPATHGFVGLYKNHKVLLVDSNGDLLVYDLETKELENLGIHGDKGYIHVFPYLVPSSSYSFRPTVELISSYYIM